MSHSDATAARVASRRRALLAGLVALVWLTDAGVAHWLRRQGQAVPEWPLAVDLLLVLPLAATLLLRPEGRTALWAALGLASLGIAAGAWMLPEADKRWWHALEQMRWLGLGAVLVMQGSLLALALRELWLAPAHLHPEPVLQQALARRLGRGPGQALLLAEARLWLYAWPGRQVQRPLDAGLPFGAWRQGQNLSNQHAFLVLMAVELPIAHGLLRLWSPALAWTVTALSLYGLLFAWAESRATRWRPISLFNDCLQLREGVLLDVALPLSCIAAVERLEGPVARQRGRWRLAGMGRCNLRLRLHTGTRLPGLTGWHEVHEICLGVDEPARLMAALTQRLENR